jgi:hypothetical protein
MSTRPRPARRRTLARAALLTAGLCAPYADVGAQAPARPRALVFVERAGVTSPSRVRADAVVVARIDHGAPVAAASSGRSVLRGAVIGAALGAAGGVAMGAWVCAQGFGCSDRARGITYWTLAGAGLGAVTGWVIHAVRAD